MAKKYTRNNKRKKSKKKNKSSKKISINTIISNDSDKDNSKLVESNNKVSNSWKNNKEERFCSKFINGLKYDYKYMIIYIVVSLAITIFVFKKGVSFSVAFFSECKVGDLKIQNSEDYIDGRLKPFFSFMGTIISVILSWITLIVLSEIAKPWSFDLANMKKMVLFIESCVVVLSAAVLFYVYSKPEILELRQYGIDTNTVSQTGQYNLQQVPNISSAGITSPNASLIYIIITNISSRLNDIIIKNIELYISIISALIIPLKCKAEILDIKSST